MVITLQSKIITALYSIAKNCHDGIRMHGVA